MTVNPRRGPYDKAPWKNLDLTAITGQTIESRHVFDVHLGETVVPYATLAPLKAVLPLKRGAPELPTHEGGPGGVRLEALEWRMRERWRTINGFWEGNKALANKLEMLGRLNYMKSLSSQLDWQHESGGDRRVRLIYTDSGTPTATLLSDNYAIVDSSLYSVICQNSHEANYILAIINSDALYEAATPLMPKGQFGAMAPTQTPLEVADSGIRSGRRPTRRNIGCRRESGGWRGEAACPSSSRAGQSDCQNRPK